MRSAHSPARFQLGGRWRGVPPVRGAPADRYAKRPGNWAMMPVLSMSAMLRISRSTAS
jgi:hypothetical protein